MLSLAGLALAFINIIQDTASKTASLRSSPSAKVLPPPSSNAELPIPQPRGNWGIVNESVLTMHKIVKLLHEQGQSGVREEVIK